MLDQKVTGVTPDFFSYTISKLALHNATRMLAMSLWPKTRVNGIAPGLVLRSGDQTEEQFRQVHNRTPLGVGPSLEEICRAVVAAGGDAVDHGPGHHHRRRAAPAHQVPVRGPAEGMSRMACRSWHPGPDPGQRCVVVDDLRLRFFIGVHEHEKRARQEVSITRPHVRAATPGPRSDDLADYVSYADIVDQAEGAGGVHAATSSWWRRWPRRWPSWRWRTRASPASSSTCARPRSSRRRRASASSSTAGARPRRGGAAGCGLTSASSCRRTRRRHHRPGGRIRVRAEGRDGELVLCADDDLDYAALLPAELRAGSS